MATQRRSCKTLSIIRELRLHERSERRSICGCVHAPENPNKDSTNASMLSSRHTHSTGPSHNLPIKPQGLIPPVVETLEDQIERSLEQLKSFDKPINKYIYLNGLQRTNQTLFYATLAAELEACLPIVYTPTGTVALYARRQRISPSSLLVCCSGRSVPEVCSHHERHARPLHQRV